MDNQYYPGKILLFGEYLLINGGKALAIPLDKYRGKWSFEKSGDQRDLRQFLAYIERLQSSGEMAKIIDTPTWERDLNQGLWFDSTIPEGYGVGSSGALVAAVYDRYVLPKKRETEEKVLMKILATMEGFFHGNSSGFDPLVSYLKKGLLLNEKGEVDAISYQLANNSPHHFFLIDTQKTRETAPLVKKYLMDCEDPDFFHRLKTEIIPASNACIDAFIAPDFELLFQRMKVLSNYQFKYFKNMIPEKHHSLWEKGLSGNDYILKLCGAGGGGYLLGFGSTINEKQVLYLVMKHK